MPTLAEQLIAYAATVHAAPDVRARFIARAAEGALTRDENPASHVGVYFLPYDAASRRVFIVHHKKSGLHIFPGGHADAGEHTQQTLAREVREELGLAWEGAAVAVPFLLTLTPIPDPVRSCKEHLDVWFLFPTDGAEFHVDPAEFHKTQWLTITEARRIVTDAPNLEALTRIEALERR